MVRPNSRFTAGVGAVAAVLLVGAPGAGVAVADRGASDRSGDRHYSARYGDGNAGGNHPDRRGDGNSGGGRGSDETTDMDVAARTTVGSGPRNTVRDETPGDQSATRPAVRESTTAGGSGSEFRRAEPAAPGSPAVRFGNGRTPRHVPPAAPRPQGIPAPVVAQVPGPPYGATITAPAPSATVGVVSPPMLSGLAVSRSGIAAGPLFASAGLVLISAAGAMLGYRQAKAAQAVNQPDRS